MSLRSSGSPPVRRTFSNAQGDEDPDHPQVILHGQLGKLSTLGAGAAVDALVVAAVGDGDTQIGDGASELVFQSSSGQRCRGLAAPRAG